MTPDPTAPKSLEEVREMIARGETDADAGRVFELTSFSRSGPPNTRRIDMRASVANHPPHSSGGEARAQLFR